MPVIVCCKLPHGIVLEHPLDPSKKVTLNGLNSSKIIGAIHGVTRVDDDFWKEWHAANAEFTPLKSGAIFVAKNEASADAISKEQAERKTGFEPMATDGKDSRAPGVKPVDKE